MYFTYLINIYGTYLIYLTDQWNEFDLMFFSCDWGLEPSISLVHFIAIVLYIIGIFTR